MQLRDYDTIFVRGRWCINQESESCPSCSQHIVLHIFMKFRHHNPYGSEVVVYKQDFAKDRQIIQQVKINGYRFCLFHMVLMRYIFPGSFLKIA